MVLFGRIILPVCLLLGAIYLIIVEINSFKQMKNSGYPLKNLRVRLYRRLTGSAILIMISILFFWGLNLLPNSSANFFMKQAAIWITVLGLVFISVILAAWDVFDSLNFIKMDADRSMSEDIKKIKKYIKDKNIRQRNKN